MTILVLSILLSSVAPGLSLAVESPPTQNVQVNPGQNSVTVKLNASTANICSQNGFISQPIISSDYSQVTGTGIPSNLDVDYSICGPTTSLAVGQIGTYAVILQLFQGSQLSTTFAIKSGTIILSSNRRSGPNLSNPSYESYNTQTASWNQINPLTIQYQQQVVKTAALGILDLMPGAASLIVGAGAIIGQLLGSSQTLPIPPGQFTDSNDNYISAFPISSWGTNQYAVVFSLSPDQPGPSNTEVYLWATVQVGGTGTATFSIPIQSPNYFPMPTQNPHRTLAEVPSDHQQNPTQTSKPPL